MLPRQAALAVLSRANREELASALATFPEKPAFETIRAPETGLVMARGRIGGGGAPFNLGEVTVTRAVVKTGSGHLGFGHILGRDREKALLVARFDAMWQDERYRGAVESALIGPVRRRLDAEDELKARKAAATRVNFFTLVRGEDE